MSLAELLRGPVIVCFILERDKVLLIQVKSRCIRNNSAVTRRPTSKVLCCLCNFIPVLSAIKHQKGQIKPDMRYFAWDTQSVFQHSMLYTQKVHKLWYLQTQKVQISINLEHFETILVYYRSLWVILNPCWQKGLKRLMFSPKLSRLWPF